MGCTSSRSRRTGTIFIFGLDGAGKTSFVYRMKTGIAVLTIPTIGFNIETVEALPNHLSHDAFTESDLLLESTVKRPKLKPNLTIWDVGGAEQVRPLWRQYCTEGTIDSYIFMVDSSARKRFPEAKEALEEILQTMRKVHLSTPIIILVVCSKADVAGAATVEEIKSELALETNFVGVVWTIIATSATANQLSEERRYQVQSEVRREAKEELERNGKTAIDVVARCDAIDNAFWSIVTWGPGMEECVDWLTAQDPTLLPSAPASAKAPPPPPAGGSSLPVPPAAQDPSLPPAPAAAGTPSQI